MLATKMSVPLDFVSTCPGSLYLQKLEMELGMQNLLFFQGGESIACWKSQKTGGEFPFLIDYYDQSGVFVVIYLSFEGRMYSDVKHTATEEDIIVKKKSSSRKLGLA